MQGQRPDLITAWGHRPRNSAFNDSEALKGRPIGLPTHCSVRLISLETDNFPDSKTPGIEKCQPD